MLLGAMLSSMYRFHGHGSLNYLFRNGRTVRHGIMLVRFVGNRRRKTSRASVIVAKKVSKSAVVRNRIRRRVYEVLRRNWSSTAAPVDMAITVLSPEAADMSAEGVECLVAELLHKAGLYQTAI